MRAEYAEFAKRLAESPTSEIARLYTIEFAVRKKYWELAEYLAEHSVATITESLNHAFEQRQDEDLALWKYWTEILD